MDTSLFPSLIFSGFYLKKSKTGHQNTTLRVMNNMAEGQGLEPRFTGPEPVVLPLDDPSVQKLKTWIKP